MSLSSSIVWEVRTAGADTAGGGFKTGASGTDWSQQNAAQYALTGLTTAAANAIILTASAAADMVGNVIQITSGTNFITGFYEILSVSAGVSITVDRNCTSAAGASGVGNIGGALATVNKAVTNHVASNTIWVKNGSYTTTATMALTGGSSSTSPTRIIGYNSTRGDLDTVADFTNFPTVQISSSAASVFSGSGQYLEYRNLILDANSVGVDGINATQSYKKYSNLKVMNHTTGSGIQDTGAALYERCWLLNGGSGSIGINADNNTSLTWGCIAKGNGTGFKGPSVFIGCVADSNDNDGFFYDFTFGVRMTNCVSYGNGRDGVRFGHVNATDLAAVRNCIFVSNGGYGINMSSGSETMPETALINWNAFKSNTSGARNQVTAGDNDVTLSADPFTNAAGGDFSLNSTAGGGAACRAAGFPGAFPGGTTTGYLDIGAVQHADPASTGGAYPVVRRGMVCRM